MAKQKVRIGRSEILEEFIAEVECSPRAVQSLLLASPFIPLGEETGFGARLRRIIHAVKEAGGKVCLISDDTPKRRQEFQAVLAGNRAFNGSLLVFPRLHAKCGCLLNS